MSEREHIKQSIAALEAQRAVLGDAVVDSAIAALREKLATLESPHALEQRKQVTVLFADTSGFTAMSESMDAEDVHNMMNDLWARLDGAITAHGGLIDKHIGDAVMAVFGAPTACEDDPDRAIRAALAMQAELADFRERRHVDRSIERSWGSLAMRIGINTGPVLLGEVGTTSEYTAIGDAVNLAKRLERAAPVGGILISHDTYRHVRGVFDVQPLEPIRIKGRTEPVQAYVVLRAKPHAFRVSTRGVEGVETRTIGRETELSQLQEALRAVVEQEEARVATVVGEAGVGKSRLLYEFNNWIELLPQSVLYFKGRARQQTSNLPYSLISNLFLFHFQIRYSDSAAVARKKLEQGIIALWDEEGIEKAHFIGQLIGFDFSTSSHLRGIIGDARQIRDRAFHYVAQFFAAATEDSPAVVFLEDIHWADDGSLDLVDYLALKCGHMPLLIVAVARPELLERRPSWMAGHTAHTCVELHPLSVQDSNRLVEEILCKVREIPPDLRDLIVSRAEGNPFYIEELVKALIEDGVIVKDPDQWRVEMERLAEARIPPTLTGVLQARLDGLSPVERETLQRASVIGRVFWDTAVARLSSSTDERINKNDIHAALKMLQERELVFEQHGSTFEGDRQYIFKHTILHEITYESVLKRLRRIYHAQAAAWLIERSGERVGEYAGVIGAHYERAGEKEQAVEWYGRAARQAQDTHALETALDYYQRALASEERWKWRKGLVEVLHILGRRDEEKAALEALENISEDPDYQEAKVARLWWQYYEAIGDYARALFVVERALAAARDQGEGVIEVDCLAQLGLISRRMGDYESAKMWYEQALTLFQDQESYPEEAAQALVRALNGLGTVHRQQGNFDEAKACYERAWMLSRLSGDRRGEAEALNDLGVTAFYRRNFAKAEVYHRRALEIRRAIGDRAGEGLSLGNLAQVAREIGDYGQGREYLLESLTIYHATGDRWEEVNAWNDLGILYQELGDLLRAQSCLQQGLALSQEIGDEAGEAYILSNLGPVVRDRGDLEAAEELLTDGLALAQRQDDKYMVSYYLSHLGMVSLQAGRLDQAIENADVALIMRRELDLTLWTTADLTTLAAAYLAIGDIAQALDYTQQALIILDECDGEGPECPQRDYLLCYRVLAAADQEEAARRALGSAYNLVKAKAEKITDLDLRQSFLERVQVNREIVQKYESVMYHAR